MDAAGADWAERQMRLQLRLAPARWAEAHGTCNTTGATYEHDHHHEGNRCHRLPADGVPAIPPEQGFDHYLSSAGGNAHGDRKSGAAACKDHCECSSESGSQRNNAYDELSPSSGCNEQCLQAARMSSLPSSPRGRLLLKWPWGHRQPSQALAAQRMAAMGSNKFRSVSDLGGQLRGKL